MKPPSSQRGFALIITLAIVTIMTALLLTFLVNMQLDRQTTSNYSQSIKAEEIGFGALQEISSGLVQEMDAGSKADGTPAGSTYTVNGVRIYIPKTNVSAVPARIGFPASSFSTDVDTAKLPPTLIRVSRDSTDPFYASPSATDYDTSKLPTVYASLASTATVSANHRSISSTRWNKPLFMSSTASTVPSDFTANPPEWVYVTRSGSRVCTDAEAKSGVLKADPAGTHTNAVLGRYAYVIYDEGAVLDANVAGADATTTTTPSVFGGKSFVSYADLTQIPGLSQSIINGLVAWRNQGGLSANGNYITAVTQSSITGFLSATSTSNVNDNPFFGRQDMIDYFTTVVGNTSALPYLGTFSRAVNAPSWCPETPATSPSTGTSTIDYASLAETTTSSNRNIPNVRATDGTPLIQTRFPLSLLALVTHTATATSGDPIYQYFGLTRSSSKTSWTYNHGDPNNILTLDQVKTAGRQPDFFELLKAAILSGSLGRDPGSVATSHNLAPGPAGTHFELYSANVDLQVMQIGANIIDQYGSDSYPTAIYLAKNTDTTPEAILQDTAFGQKDLPTITRLYLVTFAYQITNAGPERQGTFGIWLQPQIWNPNQKPVNAPSAVPTQFRISTYGQMQALLTQSFPPSAAFANALSSTINYDANPVAGQVIIKGTPDSFREQPLVLTTGNAAAPSGAPINMWNSSFNTDPIAYSPLNQFVGVCVGTLNYDTATPVATLANPNPTNGLAAQVVFQSPVTFSLDYSDDGGTTWYPYNLVSRLAFMDGNQYTLGTTTPVAQADFATVPVTFLNRPDPRTDRFSVASNFIGSGGSSFSTAVGRNLNEARLNNTLMPSGSAFASNGPVLTSVAKYVPRTTSGFNYTPAGTTQYFVAGWQDNISGEANSTWYNDPDGIVRPADGYRKNTATGDGCILYHTTSATPVTGIDTSSAGRRPVILNRAFTSVGDLGYAFRDEPFKSLDFWSKTSGDAALLDFFCLETPNVMTSKVPAVVAGEVDVNHASVPVLEALLSGARKKEIDTTSVLATSDVSLVAPAMANYIQSNPLLNRADLVTSSNGGTDLSSIINGALAATADKSNKAYGEAPVRALSSVANTRTWNLMIDVIVQSGRMSPTAQTLNDFLVEGEKRYWLHIAIDRYTGKVVDEQLEPVYE